MAQQQPEPASTRILDTDVLVVGGGPIGLTLAIDLASRGVDVVIAELRRPGEPPSPKCNHVAARSMEIFRRLGVAAALRNAGLPADYPNDVAYRTTFTGIELTRIPIPCRRDRYVATGGPDTSAVGAQRRRSGRKASATTRYEYIASPRFWRRWGPSNTEVRNSRGPRPWSPISLPRPAGCPGRGCPDRAAGWARMTLQ